MCHFSSVPIPIWGRDSRVYQFKVLLKGACNSLKSSMRFWISRFSLPVLLFLPSSYRLCTWVDHNYIPFSKGFCSRLLKCVTWLQGTNVCDIPGRILQLRMRRWWFWCVVYHSRALNSDLNSPVLKITDSFFKQHVISQGKSRYWVVCERNKAGLWKARCIARFVSYSIYSWTSENWHFKFCVQIMFWRDVKRS